MTCSYSAAQQEAARVGPLGSADLLAREQLREAVAEEQCEKRIAAVVGERRDEGVDPGVGGRIRHRLEQDAQLAPVQETQLFEQVADGCSEGLMRVALDYGVPVANGVLAVDRFEDAQARAGGSHGNKGEEAALVVIEMCHLLDQLPAAQDLLEVLE